jgi:two-component system OmpR family sensor kinase
MNGRLRLSLRARLLAALLAVTTAFLVVLGVVVSVVFGGRLGNAFDAQLVVAARRQIVAMVGARDTYAVYYSLHTRRSGQISASSATGQQLQSYLDQRIAGLGASRRLGSAAEFRPFSLTPPGGGPALRAVWHFAGPRVERRQSTVPQGLAVIVVARPLSEREAPLRDSIIAEVITGAVLIALLAAFGPWLIRRGLAPLDRMATTANQITSRGDLTARMPDSGDRAETGRLTSAINTMLDRIQQAFGERLASEQKVRQFAADASHELRTPLTTIRGYAELYRQGALGPDRLPDAMRRIEQESDRMSRLVAELLELARLDRMSSLDLRETDLSLLVRDAVADATAVESGRPVYADAPPRLIAVVDEPRVRQVLANLLGNVREHTPPGTPTAVRLAEAGQGVVLEVADSGPGMSAENAARAFDRFHRGGTSTADGGAGHGGPGHGGPGDGRNGPTGRDGHDGRDGPDVRDARQGDRSGSGLGLSIVQAIARAHGGEAVIESVPGRGTRVRVWLPTRLAAPQAGP